MAWADMSPLERLQHSLKHGTDYQNKVTDPGLWDAVRASSQRPNAGGANFVNGTPTIQEQPYGHAPVSGPRPEGISDYMWARVQNNTYAGLNEATITNDPEVRDALIEAGYGDYVKGAYEEAMRQRASHYGSNDAGDAWGNAQYDWYTENYGEYRDDSVNTAAGNQADNLALGHGVPDVGGDYTGGKGGAGSGGGDYTGGADVPDSVSTSTASESTPLESGFRKGRSQGTFDVGGGSNVAAGAASSTPFADAYLRTRAAAQAEGPVSKLFKDYL